jgi:KaiC/GvpD/RAD55 family RecA-like ATPase
MARIKTYIEGFDEILNGGIPQGSVVLISGTTGTMKSSLAYSILYNNARNGTKGLYLSLQHSEKNLLAQTENFGMPYQKVAGSLYIVDRYKLQEGVEKYFKKTFFDTLLEHLLILKQDFNYRLIAIDCLSALETISELKTPRADIFRFFEWLRKLDATSFLITEMSPDSESYGKYDEDFLADSIIHLKMEEISEIKIQRRIRCVKLRTSLHSTDWYALFFSEGRFRVAEVISEASGR